MAPDYGVVTGNFLTPGQSAGAPVPLSGTIVFTPTSKTQVDGILYVSQSTGYVVAGKLCDDPAGAHEGIRLIPGTYHVQYALTANGATAPIPSHPLEIVPGGGEVSLTGSRPLSSDSHRLQPAAQPQTQTVQPQTEQAPHRRMVAVDNLDGTVRLEMEDI